jgi:hypothetical protein
VPDDAPGHRPAVVEVRAHPRASRDAVGPYRDGILHVRTVRPPAGGEANAAVARLLARTLDVAPSRVRLVAGERGRAKRFEVDGLDAEALAGRLAAMGGSD